MRLRYHDSSSMARHLNAFQGLINQTTSLEVPLADKVLALLLLGSVPLDDKVLALLLLGSDGKHLSSLLNEQARQKDGEPTSHSLQVDGRLNDDAANEVPCARKGRLDEPGGRMCPNEQNDHICLPIPNRGRDLLVQVHGEDNGQMRGARCARSPRVVRPTMGQPLPR